MGKHVTIRNYEGAIHGGKGSGEVGVTGRKDIENYVKSIDDILSGRIDRARFTRQDGEIVKVYRSVKKPGYIVIVERTRDPVLREIGIITRRLYLWLVGEGERNWRRFSPQQLKELRDELAKAWQNGYV